MGTRVGCSSSSPPFTQEAPSKDCLCRCSWPMMLHGWDTEFSKEMLPSSGTLDLLLFPSLSPGFGKAESQHWKSRQSTSKCSAFHSWSISLSYLCSLISLLHCLSRILTIWAVQKYPQIHPHLDPECGCLIWYLYTPSPTFSEGQNSLFRRQQQPLLSSGHTAHH